MDLATADIEIAKYRQEWWKVGISALTPIMIAILTFFITDALNSQQSALRKGEQVLQEKQKLYSSLGSNLDIIYVYVMDVGDFRHYTPDQIIETKRETDRQFFMYKPYWSQKTSVLYNSFMKLAFKTYVGTGQNAQIRSAMVEKKAAYVIDSKQWNPDWDKMFTEERPPDEFTGTYYDLVRSFLEDTVSSAIFEKSK
jgi:hypothetical protein